MCKAHLRDELLVLRGLHVLAKVDRAQLELLIVLIVRRITAGEGGVAAATHGRRDLPRKKTRRDGADGVESTALKLATPAREGQHRPVAAADVVGKGQALHHVILCGGQAVSAVRLVLDKPARVAAGHVATAGNVAHDQHVLRLGDHGLEVAPAQENTRNNM